MSMMGSLVDHILNTSRRIIGSEKTQVGRSTSPVIVIGDMLLRHHHVFNTIKVVQNVTKTMATTRERVRMNEEGGITRMVE